jgi:hypothetical protein
LILLGHDHDPQRLDTATAPPEIGSFAGRHRHGWFLLPQLLQCDIRPSAAQHSLDLVPIHAIVGDHHQRRVITAGHASEAHVAPSIPAPCRPIAHIAQCTPQPSYSVRQASRRIDPHDRKARRCRCRPLGHASPPAAITPHRLAHFDVDPLNDSALRSVLRLYYDQGVHGVLVNGTTGE